MSVNDVSKGEYLKQVRESKGIPLESVHEATKIPMDALRAIEEGYTVRTLSSFYYKGFLKIYAQYLDVDVSRVVDNAEPEPYVEDRPEQPLDRMEIKTNFEKMMTPQRKQLIAKIIGIVIVLFVFAKFVGFVKGFFSSRADKVAAQKYEKKEDAKKQSQSEKELAKKAVRTVASQAAEAAPVAAIDKKISIPQATEVTLTVKAKKSSWLRVKADDDVVFQSTLKQGIAETWTAKESIEITGKNINLLEFEINGKLIGSLGRADRNARKLIVTREGLSIKN